MKCLEEIKDLDAFLRAKAERLFNQFQMRADPTGLSNLSENKPRPIPYQDDRDHDAPSSVSTMADML
jgi:hypothetical protein